MSNTLTSHEILEKSRETSSKPKVWVIHDKGAYIFDKAERYGEVVSLVEGTINVFNKEALLAVLLPELSKVGENDYLLLVGHAVPCHYAIDYVIKKHGFARCLIYAAGSGNYRVLRMDDEQY